MGSGAASAGASTESTGAAAARLSGGGAQAAKGERGTLLANTHQTDFPGGHGRRLENPGLLDLVMIEVQSGDYLGEDDIVRFQDNYGRT